MKKLLNLPPVRFLVGVFDLYMQCGVGQSAAALAYFLILTLFPLLMCANYFIGLFHLDLEQLLLDLGQVLPTDAVTVIREYFLYVSRANFTAVLPVALSAIVLSASAGLRILLNAMDRISGRETNHPLRRVLLSVALSLVFLVAIYLSVVVIFTGEWFFHLLEQQLPGTILAVLPLSALSDLWLGMRYLLLFCIMLLIVLILYRTGLPRYWRGWQMVLSCGATAAAMVGCSILFSWFISMSSRYSLLYGSLASLIILLVWLYFCGNILLLGAVVGRVLRRMIRHEP